MGCVLADGTYDFDVQAARGNSMHVSRSHDLGNGPVLLELFSKQLSEAELAAESADNEREVCQVTAEHCGGAIAERYDCLHDTDPDADPDDMTCAEFYCVRLLSVDLDEADCAPYVERGAGFPALNTVGAAGRPSRGPAGAPVIIIEFSDYENDITRSAQTTIEKVLQTYGDKVRLVYRDLPLTSDARRAARAAKCATQQEKFWQYHARLFDAADLTDAGLRELAEATGLNVPQFARCLAQSQPERDVAIDIADAKKAGVTGPPTLFINGNRIHGATAVGTYRVVIDKELARAARATH